jgi:phenylalanyl-tRNA synthetase alpha subunit
MPSAGAVEMRWVDTYFPFTNPSFELEIYFQVFVLSSFSYSCLKSKQNMLNNLVDMMGI